MLKKVRTPKNRKVLLVAGILSVPFFWGTIFASDIAAKAFLERELTSNPEILAAFAAQKDLEQKLHSAYPLSNKGVTPLQLNARAAASTLVRENGTTKLLFSQRHESPAFIASVTKLMTAFVAIHTYRSTHQEVIITPEIVFVEGHSGQLKPWQIFTIRDLLYISLIESSNDAATALTIPMGYNAFITEMNTQADLLGMDTASFVNPTGLDEANSNQASPQDLTTLAIHLKNKYPQVFDIVSQQQFPMYTTDGTFHHTLINTNELLGYKEWPGKVFGGKTGWTPQAKQSLLLVVESPDKKGYIVNVILGSDDRFGEMRKLLRWSLDSYKWNL